MSGHQNIEIGFSTNNITPKKPVFLSGWINRDETTSKVASDLEINTININYGSKGIYLTSADSLYLNDDLFTELRNENTFIFPAASHTHFAPGIDKTKPALGKFDEEYYSFFKEEMSKGFVTAKESSDSGVSIEYFRTTISLNINRRRKNIYYWRNPFKWESKVELGPNYLGKNNREIHILAFKDANKNIIGVLWTFACHPTNWPNRNEVSSDFIGVVRSHLRARYGNIAVIFLQGFSGNLKARDIWKTIKTLELKKELLRLKVEFPVFSVNEFNEWSSLLASKISNTIKNKGREINPFVQFKEYVVDINALINEENTHQLPDLKISILQITPKLVLIGFSAEPVVEYIDIIKNIFKNITVIPVGCVGSVFGYLPTDKMIKEGGYEARGFIPIFGYDFSFRKKIQNQIITILKQAYLDLNNYNM